MIEQHFVELGARYLIRPVGLRLKAIFKIEFCSSGTGGSIHLAAEFFHESSALEFLVQPETRECFHAEWQKRFADMEAGEFVALEHDNFSTGTSQQGSGRAAGGPPTDNCDVEDSLTHAATKVAKLARKQMLLRNATVIDRRYNLH